MELNEEQRAVVNLRQGCFQIQSGPGSGKTRVIVERAVRLFEEGLVPNELLTLTFTNSAARNLRDRVEDRIYTPPPNRLAGFRTFHSYALEFCERERKNLDITLADNFLATEGQTAKIGYEVAGKFKLNWRALRAYISFQKRNRIEPPLAITLAEKAGSGQAEALAYKLYNKKAAELGILDFDSLMLETVKALENNLALRAKYQYFHCMVDEFQDTDSVQLRLIQLLTERHGNLLLVGDGNQCQPPGTKVLLSPQCTVEGRKRHYFSRKTGWCACGAHQSQHLSSENIESLTENDAVVSWTKADQRTYPTFGRNIRVASRFYQGDMLSIYCNGNVTRMTPNHWVWTRFNRKAFEDRVHFVYLMYREDLGFRVGISQFRRRGKTLHHVTGRSRQEGAEKIWVLRLVPEGREYAGALEQIISLRYRIPQSVFAKGKHHYKSSTVLYRASETIKMIFDSVSKDGGFECLKDYGLLYDHGFAEYTDDSKKLQKFHGYFQTAACNLFPKYFDLPTTEINRSSPIDNITKESYSGLVYSLDVEKDHTYVADGIPVGNSIFRWRGASDVFGNIEQAFPGIQKLFLCTNYRSTQAIVSFIKKISDNDKFNTPNEEGVEPEIRVYSTPAREAQEVVKLVALDPENSAILCRTNNGLRDCEEQLIEQGVKYHLLGKSGFWTCQEVKNVVPWLQCAVAPTDPAILAAIRSPFWPSKYLKKKLLADELGAAKIPAIELLSAKKDRGVQDFLKFLRSLTAYRYFSAKDTVGYILRDLKAVEYYKEEELVESDNSPVENLRELARAAERHESLRDFLNFIRRIQNASKSRKGVALSTIHSAKGQEWGRVFLVQVSEGILPHKRSTDLTEERNLFYVACSRPEQELHISYSGQKSRFLEELCVAQNVDDPLCST